MAEKKAKSARLDAINPDDAFVETAESIGLNVTVPKPKPTGRPTSFTQDLADRICEQITEGKSLRTICKADDMPSIATIFNWHRSQPGFLEQYTRAKEEQADTNAEDIQELAMKVVKGEVDPQSARVAIDAYKWTSSKLKAKKYGDKIDVDTKSEITHRFSNLEDEELDRALKAAGINPSGDIKL